MPARPVLYVCSVDQRGPRWHPCRLAHEQLVAAGIDHEKIVHARNHPGGLLTKGRRPRLKAISGQEKLPVLVLEDGRAIAGGKRIAEWARSHAGA